MNLEQKCIKELAKKLNIEFNFFNFVKYLRKFKKKEPNSKMFDFAVRFFFFYMFLFGNYFVKSLLSEYAINNWPGK